MTKEEIEKLKDEVCNLKRRLDNLKEDLETGSKLRRSYILVSNCPAASCDVCRWHNGDLSNVTAEDAARDHTAETGHTTVYGKRLFRDNESQSDGRPF